MARHKMPHVMVLLPGITGSVLKKDGKVVWGFSASSIAKALFTLGGSMRKALALPRDDPNADDLGDGVTADSLMSDLHLLPGIWKIDGYTKIADAVLASFEVEEGKNFFRFPYDWRRDNRVAARKLARDSHNWLTAWRKTSGNQNAKLILVGHSMGGLVCRYFLECMEGWKVTEALISFGTPYRGSLNALDGLCNGLKKGPVDLTELVRQLPALYQLLPVYECYDSGNGKLERVGEVRGIPHVNPDMAASALGFHREIEEAEQLNEKLGEYQSGRYKIYPVVGVFQPTNLSARLVGGKVEMLQTYEGKALGGDGTVPRVSAIPIELSNHPASAMYAATQHGSLQNADPVITHLTGLLSGMNIDLGSFRKPKIQVALQIDDAYYADEPVSVRARPTQKRTSLNAAMWRGEGGRPTVTQPLQAAGEDWVAANFGPLPPGAYRVTVSGKDVETAEDSFAVWERRVADL